MGEFFVNNNLRNQRSKTQASYLPEELKYNEINIEKTKSNLSNNIKIDAGNSLTSILKSDAASNLQLQLQKEILWETTSDTRIINFSHEHIDFHYVGNGETSSPFALTISNNSNKKINIKWVLERPIIISNLIKTVNLFQNNDSIFIIQPEEIIINPHSTFDFKVYFKPNKQEFYFYNDIPCFATVVDNDNFNNFQITSSSDMYNQTSVGFNALKHEREKKEMELNRPSIQSNKMGNTAYNFKSNGIQKNNQLKPLPFKGAMNPAQTTYGNANGNKKNSQTKINSKNVTKTAMNFHTKKLKKIN